jgi:hypothetical protein
MLGTFVAGRYSATYQPPGESAYSIGIMEEGYQLQYRALASVINKSDAYGMTPIEAFHQGFEVFIAGSAREWIAGVHKMLNPINGWTGGAGGIFSNGTIGVAHTDRAGTLVLTATAGTPAAASPASLTAAYAMLAENFDVSMLFGPAERLMPWRLRIWPYSSSGIKFFTTT